jgi:16S rRNA (cytidine1402-2'-O)-methyltransferase
MIDAANIPSVENKLGILFLIPTHVTAATMQNTQLVLPTQVIATAVGLTHYIAENAKTARMFLKAIGVTRPLAEISIAELDKHTRQSQQSDYSSLLAPLLAGSDVGLVSEAGAPAVADPGALVVAAAHRVGIAVKPLVGPSSLLLALMASGLNGQSFVFHGYLPQGKADRARRIIHVERESKRQQQTQMFIETPYRNQALLSDLLTTLSPTTQLCVATDLTGAMESVRTKSVADWRASNTSLDKLPTIFLLLG